MKGTLYGWGLLLALGLADYAEFSRALDEMYLQNPEDARLNALESAQNEKDAICRCFRCAKKPTRGRLRKCCFRGWRRHIEPRRLSKSFIIRTSFSA